MASSYWCEKSLPLQWLWINEIAGVETGVAINRQLLVTQLLNYVLCPLSLLQDYFAVKLFGKCLPCLNVCFLLEVDRSMAPSFLTLKAAERGFKKPILLSPGGVKANLLIQDHHWWISFRKLANTGFYQWTLLVGHRRYSPPSFLVAFCCFSTESQKRKQSNSHWCFSTVASLFFIWWRTLRTPVIDTGNLRILDPKQIVPKFF